MQKTDSVIKRIKEDKKIGSRIFLITLMMALFILALVVKDNSNDTRYLEDKNGNITQIIRGSTSHSDQYNFKLSIVKGKEREERPVKINKQAATDAKKTDKQTAEENKAMEREAEISGIITDIELSDKKKIELPGNLSDGSRLYWSLDKEGINSYALIPFVYVALILLAIKSSFDGDKEASDDMRKLILRGLPRFSNQLMLMLNAGVILSDAFDYICNSYELLGEKNMDVFQHELVALNKSNTDHRLSTASLINNYAAKYNVKELMRISTILHENEKRGSDVIESLNRESKYLWDDRKIIARESGKMIDTKMSYPMGMLLILLIVITMAPALMNL